MKSQKPSPRSRHDGHLQAVGSRKPWFESTGKVLGLVTTAIAIAVGSIAIYEHVKAPLLGLELMRPYTGWEVSIKNTGTAVAKQVHIGVVVWRMNGAPAADVRHSYRIEDLPPNTQSSIRVEVFSDWHDPKYLEEISRDSRSGYIVVSCDGCRKPRAWAFYIPGTEEHEKERTFFRQNSIRWPTVEFRYPDRVPFLGNCVNYPRGVCESENHSYGMWNADTGSSEHDGTVATPYDVTMPRE